MGHRNEGTAGSKSELRKHILMIRNGMQPEDRVCRDSRIRERVWQHPAYRDAQVILAYASYRSEANTMLLIQRALDDGKEVFAPKVSGDEMEFWQITALQDLRSGYRGIPEPVQSLSLPEWAARKCLCPFSRENSRQDGKTDGYSRCNGRNDEAVYRAMMWMPGAVFDKERHRIGYGRGFYDRYLGRTLDADRQMHLHGTVVLLTTAALAYDCQVVGQIPSKPHDVRPDMVITESRQF